MLFLMQFPATLMFEGRNALNMNVEVQVSILSVKDTVFDDVSIEFCTP